MSGAKRAKYRNWPLEVQPKPHLKLRSAAASGMRRLPVSSKPSFHAAIAARAGGSLSVTVFSVIQSIVGEGVPLLFEPCDIPDVVTITPIRHDDSRGHFTELFRNDLFKARVADVMFVQYNQSLSRLVGTVRGLHYQLAPAAQGKLVRCVRGTILDVAVDLRRASPTFRKHVAIELSSETQMQLWIPEGFAHGFCTLTPDTEVWYAVTHPYSPVHERGIVWNDPELGIDWPVSTAAATVGARDLLLPRLEECAADLGYV